jgi:RNA polymerase primary sigma factor
MIINSNLKFVASVAKDYIGLGLPYSDLIAEGNLGLLKAIDNFDYQRGFKTISYSVWWIRQTIMEALKKRNSIKCDELIEEQKNDIDCDFEDEYNINEQDNNYDEYEDFDSFKNSEEIKIISMLFDGLSQREIFILKNYFGLDGYEELTLEKIGEELNLTKERVRQIKECALKKLRSAALEKSITSEIYR